MATPKSPQDHKPKIETVKGGRKVTLRGVTVTVEDAALDDFELLEDLRAIDEDSNGTRLPGLLRRLVGGESYREVMDALRDPATGRVPIVEGGNYIKELFEAISPES